MAAPRLIADLVRRFFDNRSAYRSGQYNETQLRREFLDPFWEALGWDVNNTRGIAEAYKEVIHEDAITIEGAAKAPDYCFRIGAARKFFVEAKRPSVNVKTDVSPAYQLRRYAWSAGLPLSIVTDFEEFAVYDTRVRPGANDPASKARVMFLTCNDYIDRWPDVANIFSRDAVWKGSFDKYVDSTRSKRGTTPVDDAFLGELELWREDLAKNLALRNRTLSQEDLNFAVQAILDRIVFLRICEDRGVEKYGRLRELTDGVDVYRGLCDLFQDADDRYNSGLFYFTREKGRHEHPDELTPALEVDDALLRNLIRRLYYPNSPYEFSVVPAAILGQVYEQFLGKVIRLTPGHQARVEDKPEVKKVGGVFYTPSYVVDYIVNNTLGALLKSATLRQVAKIRVLDPACGSGSFLLSAYQKLLDWHRDWYTEHDPQQYAKGRRPTLYQASGGGWNLTVSERKRILTNSIFGVDVDGQAIEVTKLSLLLKVLEGESEQTLAPLLRLFHERALPDLGKNIRCGNSLIDPSFHDSAVGAALSDQELERLRAFDWNREFPQVMQGGGFDVVVGNPPYLYSAGQEFKQYFEQQYALSEYQTDFYTYFVEKSLSLARDGGYFGFIVSDSWLKGVHFSRLRQHLLERHRVRKIAMFDYQVFRGAVIENSIIIADVRQPPKCIEVDLFASPRSVKTINTVAPSAAIKRGLIDARHSSGADTLLEKLEAAARPLEIFLKINRGIHAYRTDGYGRSKYGTGPQTKRDFTEKSYHSAHPLNKTYLPELKGKHIFRFRYVNSGQFLSYGDWLAEPRERVFFFEPKIVLRKIISARLHGTFIREPMALDQSLYVAISRKGDEQELKHLLGILMSPLGGWYLRSKHAIYDKVYPWYTKKQLAAFPVKGDDYRLAPIVDELLRLEAERGRVRSPSARASLGRRVQNAMARLDRKAYELYGLNGGEIALIERGLGGEGDEKSEPGLEGET